MELFNLMIKASAKKTLYILMMSVIAGISGGVIVPLIINAAQVLVSGKLKYIRFSILHLVLSEGYRAFSEHIKCKLLTILNLTDIMTPNSVKSDSCHIR